MSHFVKNVAQLSSGTICAQFIAVAALPVITRIYSPDNFGVFGIYFSITMLIAPVSTLRFNSALMLPGSKKEAINLLGLSVVSVLCISVVLAIILGAINWELILPESLSINGFIDFLWLVPLGVLIQGLYQSFLFFTLRNKLFGPMAIARVGGSLVDKGLVLLVGILWSQGPIGLICGTIFGPFVATAYMVRVNIKSHFRTYFRSLSFAEMKRLGRRYQDFPLFSTLAFFVQSAAREAPTLLLAWFFSPIIAGFYILSMRVVSLPMRMIGDSVAKVFLQRVTEKKSVGVEEDAVQLFKYIILVTLPPVLILLWFGGNLFALVFGETWQEAGLYVQILSLSYLGMFLYRPLSTLFDAYERQRQRLLFDSIFFVARVGVVCVTAWLSGSPYITLIALTVITCLLYAVAYIYLFGLVGIRAKKVFGFALGSICVMTPLVIGLPLIKFTIEGLPLELAMLLALLIMQVAIVFIMVPGVRRETMRFLPSMR